MHYSDGYCWAARGRAARRAAARQASRRSVDSDARAEQPEHGVGTVRMGDGDAGGGGAGVRLQRLGRAG
jgi:hypothetical protein